MTDDRALLLAALLDADDALMLAARGGLGERLARSRLGCLLAPYVLVGGQRAASRMWRTHAHAVRLYREQRGVDRFAADADVDRAERQLALLGIAAPGQLVPAERQAVAAALLDLAFAGQRTNDPLLAAALDAFAALDDALWVAEQGIPDGERDALELRYRLAWRRWLDAA